MEVIQDIDFVHVIDNGFHKVQFLCFECKMSNVKADLMRAKLYVARETLS